MTGGQGGQEDVNEGLQSLTVQFLDAGLNTLPKIRMERKKPFHRRMN